MGINGGTGIVGSGAALGGSGIHINRGGGVPPTQGIGNWKIGSTFVIK